MSGSAYDSPLAELRRWEDSGGTWLVVRDDDRTIVIDLLTCSGGEVMATLRSDDAQLRAYVRDSERDPTDTRTGPA